MKRNTLFIYGIFAVLLFSCAEKRSVEKHVALTQTYSFKDSCKHIIFSMEVEVPTGDDDATRQIRDSLIADFILCSRSSWYEEEDTANDIQPYKGSMTDVQALVDHYGKVYYEIMLNAAVKDNNFREDYIRKDNTLTAAEKKEQLKNIPVWNYDFKLEKVIDTLDVVVYDSHSYIYSGGAHGGLSGSGALTFDKKTGKKIGRFLRSDCIKQLQPFLRNGLKDYYSEYGDTITDEQLTDRLQIDGPLIPLPVQTAFPNATMDSLTIVYKQYEIACYADGMPAFRLAVKDIKDYLTEEGKKLLK